MENESDNERHPEMCGQDCRCGHWSSVIKPRGRVVASPDHPEQVGPGAPGRKRGRVNMDYIEGNSEESF